MSHVRHRVVENKLLTDELFELVLERNNLQFLPGDCVALFAEDDKESRPYSIASGVNDSHVRFVIRSMEGGVVTSFLKTRRPGDTVNLSAPFGWFRPGQDNVDADSVFIATGTGIAPFLSYCRSYPERPPAHCLYGVRHLPDAVGLNVLQDATVCHVAVSREKPVNNEAHHGRVTDLLEHLPLTEGTHYYLCGLDSMIEEVNAWLEEKGIDFFNIHREVFFNDTRSRT